MTENKPVPKEKADARLDHLLDAIDKRPMSRKALERDARLANMIAQQVGNLVRQIVHDALIASVEIRRHEKETEQQERGAKIGSQPGWGDLARRREEAFAQLRADSEAGFAALRERISALGRPRMVQ